MRVSLIIERFTSLLEIMKKDKIMINEIREDNELFKRTMDELRRIYPSFHRFDPQGELIRIMLDVYYTVDWEKILENCRNYYDLCVVRQIRKILDDKLKEKPSYYHKLVDRFIPKRKDSPNKRINLFLRWTIRDEYPDLGLFTRYADKSRIIIPIGLEISRTAGRIFFGKELRPTRRNAIRITSMLKMINKEDPIKYDFVLSRPAILGLCNKDIEISFCEICPLRNICTKYKRIVNRTDDPIAMIKDKITKYHATLKKRHDLSIKMIMNIIEEYKKKYGFECIFDKSIGDELRPDIFCNYSSEMIMIGEAKSTIRIKTAPLQLLLYYQQLYRKLPEKNYIGIMVFGDYDPIEVKHVLEIVELLELDKIFNYIEILAYDKTRNSLLKITV